MIWSSLLFAMQNIIAATLEFKVDYGLLFMLRSFRLMFRVAMAIPWRPTIRLIEDASRAVVVDSLNQGLNRIKLAICLQP